MPEHDLEALYLQAQSALKVKDYNRAGDLLTQILVVDENYKDVSRLLAQTVALRRRRWYNHPMLWSALGVIGLIVIGSLLAPRLQGLYTAQVAITPTVYSTPTHYVIPTPMTPVFTPVPMNWKRISMGQEFPRDMVTVILVDPKDAEVIYVGTRDAGIYKTIDGGVSWQPAQNGLGGAWVSSLTFDPQNPQILYAGIAYGGVYKTVDGGNHWYSINNKVYINGGKVTVAVYPKDSKQIYYSPSDFLYFSTNGGETWAETKWENITGCPKSIVDFIVNPEDPQSLLAFNQVNTGNGSDCFTGLYQSTDGGNTWSLTLKVDAPYDSGKLVSDKTWGIIYAVSLQETYRSNDHGKNWVKLPVNGCSGFDLDPSNSAAVYCAKGNKIVVSKDSGETWADFSETPSPIQIISVSPHSSQTVLAGGQGLWVTTDEGRTWLPINNGMGGSKAEIKAPIGSDILYVQGADHKTYQSLDGGKSWHNLAEFEQALSLEGVGQNLYVLQNGLFVSSDNGKSWTQKTMPKERETPEGIAVNPFNPENIFSFHNGIYYSNDMGNTWNVASGITWGNNFRLFFDHTSEKKVYAVSEHESYRSEDGGSTWQVCPHIPSFDYGAWGWATGSDARAVVDPRDGNRLFVATRGSGIVKSTDGCKIWGNANFGLGSLFVNTITIDINHPDTLYAATDSGAYISTNASETWGQINDGLLGATVVYSIIVDKDGNVYAATPYGIFKLESK
jgi:photosystem II stability/assembly factor-like uncharacterized protein